MDHDLFRIASGNLEQIAYLNRLITALQGSCTDFREFLVPQAIGD